MARYEFERTIAAPAQECYALFSDLDRMPEISSEIVALTRTNDKGFEPGLTFSCSRVMMGKTCTESMVVEAVEPGRAYTLGCESCGAKWLSTYTFEPEGAGSTRVRLVMTCKAMTLYAKLFMPLTFLFAGTMKKLINKELDELKAACEGGGAGRAVPA